MSANILSPDERRELTTIPLDISDAELVRHFSLTSTDLAVIDHRLQPAHQLDQAAHLCLLRWLGWSPVAVNQLPYSAHAALCHQLQLDLPAETLEPPAERTSRLHAERARRHLGWHQYARAMDRDLCEWLKPLAEEYDHARVLFDALQPRLYQEKIVRPGLAHLERLVETTRNLVKARLTQAINSQLTPAQKKQLDELLLVPPGETRSPLHRLKGTPARASGPELREVLNHIETLRALGLGQLDLGPERIHPNRLKLLARRARQRTNWDAARLLPDERYPQLVCLLDQLLHERIDLAVTIHGEIIKPAGCGGWSCGRP